MTSRLAGRTRLSDDSKRFVKVTTPLMTFPRKRRGIANSSEVAVFMTSTSWLVTRCRVHSLCFTPLMGGEKRKLPATNSGTHSGSGPMGCDMQLL